MKRFFDTSVLIPAFYERHLHHEASFRVYATVSKEDSCALRTLAEIYSVLTGLPARPRFTAERALGAVEEVRRRITVVSLDDADFYLVMARAATDGIVGGAFYDALIAECAVKAQADILVTWNVRDFIRFPTLHPSSRPPLSAKSRTDSAGSC